MFAELESTDERLHEAFELLEYKNTKRAITEINKLLKKNPKSPSANALKALILLRSSKLSEAYELMTSVMQKTPADSDTLQFLSIFFRELKEEETLESYIKAALEKYPDNKDLHLSLFYIYVRSCNFNAQQATARKLCQIDNSDRRYKFWMALSTMLQAEEDAASATRLFLPLTERMLKKALDDGHFTSHDDFSIYLSILLRLNKFEEVLALLNDEKLIGLLNTLDYDHDYNPLLLKVYSQLNNWAEMVKVCENLLNVDADNWFAWESLLRQCFADESFRENVLELIEKYSKASPKSRGPRLAMIDFSANLIKRGIEHPKAKESFCVQLIKDYFNDFSRKPVGSLDLAFVIPLLVKSDTARISLVKSLLEEAKSYQNSSKLSADDKVHSEVCAFRLARTNGVRIDLTELISTYQARAMIPLPNEKDVTKETIAYDDLLQLAVSELLDPSTVDKTTERGLGCILLGAYWLSDIGLKRSPANHFMRLKLVAMLSPFGGLACVPRLLQELESLNLRAILYISICHVAITPGPFLAAFGISSKSDHQYANLINFYVGTITRVQTIQQEMENCLMRSYRRNAFGSIHEATQFLQMLGRTDVFVLAQTELMYNKVLVKCDCFDDVLEQMGPCSSELIRLREALGHICDNRDFSVLPEFYHKIPDPNNRKASFDHLRAWIRLRLELVNLIGTCLKLVMKAVPFVDMISSGDVSENSLKNVTDIMRTIDEQRDALVKHLNTHGDVVAAFIGSKFKYTDLLLAPEMVNTAPPPLPSTTMTSFYFHGPFYQTFVNGIDLLKFLTGLLGDKSVTFLATGCGL
ncbi:unnamed protein product [Rodentolepis nana]|uniref:TPR_REGION domain-containing protein n=1 Tax=Rodentolepis nana TaxID=102285 RepID=A0A0R3TXK5_RODNA|nr:unnamed protein product [Rodentolepis nana]